MSPEQFSAYQASQQGSQNPFPTSHDLQQKVEGVTGKFYEPKTKVGEYAQTAGEFLPAVAGGPENLLARLGTRVAAPAIASETAGQLTKDTAYEPWARVAAALAAHRTASDVRHGMSPGAATPTLEELHDTATGNYQAAKGFGVEIKRKPVARLADDIFSDLENDGFRERNVPKAWSAIEELKSPAGRNVTVSDIESVRKVLRKAGSNPLEGEEREAARRAVKSIDDYMANLDPKHVAVNPHYAGDVAAEMAQARGNWSAMKHDELISDKVYNAGLQAGATHSGANINNATRQKIKSILVSPKLRQGYSQEEIAQMEKIVKGTFVGNASRYVGKIVHGLAGATLGGMGGHAIAGPWGIPAAWLAGLGGKLAGDASTARQVRLLGEMVRQRSPLGKSLPQPTPPPPVPLRYYAGTGVLSRQPSKERD